MNGPRILGLSSLFLVIMISICAMGPWDFLGVYDKINTADSFLIDESYCNFSGKIYYKEIKNESYIYYIRDGSITIENQTLTNSSFLLYLQSDNIPINSFLTGKGKIDTFSIATNEGSFDLKKYYNSLGLLCSISAQQDNLNIKGPYLGLRESLYKLRKNIVSIYQKYLPGEEAGFISSITLGYKGNLNDELRNLFTEVGVAHVLAVSGLHVSVVCLGIYNMLRKGKFSFRVSAFIAGLIAILYGIITGGSVSSVRAIGMFLIYLGAQVLGEEYDQITSASILASILLIKNPLYIINSGFIFSFGITICVCYFAKPINKYLLFLIDNKKQERVAVDGISALYNETRKEKLLYSLSSKLLFSFVITATAIPIIAFMYYKIPTYSTLINFVLLPLMPVLLLLGLLGGLLGLIYLPIGGIFLRLCHFVLFFFEFMANIFSSLPYSKIITGCPRTYQIVLYYFAVAFIVIIIPFFLKEKGKSYIKYLRLIPLLMLFAVTLFIKPKTIPFEIDILDVGQGDGEFISTGNGTYIFIDGGSTSENSLGEYVVEPFLEYKGVKAIDYWFVSHTDEDHISGLNYMLENGYPIKNVIFSSQVLKNDNFNQLLTKIEDAGVNVVYMKKDDCLVAGDVSIKCIYQYKTSYDETDANAMSLPLLLKYEKNSLFSNLFFPKDYSKDNFSAFFGGDMGQDQELELINARVIDEVDFLKVSHHGSKNSSNSKFLNLLNPKIATISCGLNNSYGHPAKEAVDRIQEVCPNIYYTMYQGQIKISYKNGIKVDTYLD